MKVYKSQKEVEKDIKDGVLRVEGDVKFECSISIEAHIIVNAGDINARDISAWDINARDINARDINARDINARDISAVDISYYCFCCVYSSIKCKSINGKRAKHKEPICMDGELIIKDEEIIEPTMDEVADKFGVSVKSLKIKK